MVLSAYTESPQHVNPPYSFPIAVAVYPNSSSAHLGVFTPVRPQNEVSINPPQYEVSINPPQYEVSINLSQYEVSIILPQYEVYKIALPQNGVFETILPQPEGFEIAPVNCQLFNRVKNIISYVLNFSVNGIKQLTSAVTHHGEKSGWAIRILLECLQHVLKMYTWSLSENQASIHFKCRLTGLLLKKSLFRKHDFAAWVYRLYQCYQNLVFQHLKIFLAYRFGSCAQIREEHSKISNQFHFYGGGKSLIFSSNELLPYALVDLQEQQYQFLQCVKKDNKQSIVLGDGDILCSVPLNILTPKLTLKTAKELALLHGMYMHSKILLKNAQSLLQDHKCHTCDDLLAVFKPYKVPSNAEHQKTWYQKNTEKRAKYDKHRYSKSEYQKSHQKSMKKYYFSKKDVKFPPAPPSAELCRNIVSDFCADTSPDVFEEAGCAVCGKLTPICEMEELSEVENINLLKVDGVTRKARCKSADPVRELRGAILAPGCSRVCPICVESLEKKKVPTLALANGLWVGEIPDELQGLTYAEQLLIARVRHNRCIVKVSSGMFKMRANAISFSNPMPKIYSVLPPPIEEMDEVLAFIYTGPCKQTKADFQ